LTAVYDVSLYRNISSILIHATLHSTLPEIHTNCAVQTIFGMTGTSNSIRLHYVVYPLLF